MPAPATLVVDTDVFSYVWQARRQRPVDRGTALHYDVALVTNNRQHFERVPGLQLLP